MTDRAAPPSAPVPPAFETLGRAELDALAAAGRGVADAVRALAATGDTVVSTLIRETATPVPWQHYPPGDVYDHDRHAQYYFHAHAKGEGLPGEIGHLHTFLRSLGMPSGVAPAPVPDLVRPAGANDALAHLIGISLAADGRAIGLFTTNRWVTGETWYAARDAARMVTRFAIDHDRPSRPLNRWVTAMVQLFRPQITALLEARDDAVAAWQANAPDRLVYDDRGLEFPSRCAISVSDQVAAIDRARAGVPMTGP